ncbi:MAG TPA: stalk domain-containing protein [Methanosarcina sp.]|nr:stalk domain-containing protein [Methanosarcina sp.]
MTKLRNVKFSGLMLIMALALIPQLCWPSSAAASITAPTVITNSASSIENNTAMLNGDIMASGDTSITEYGFYYGTTSSCPTQVKVGSSINADNFYDYKLTNLQAGTQYYFKSYARNSVGTDYGSVNSFTTDKTEVSPTVTTASAAAIGTNYARLNGEITSDGDSAITSYGFYYGTNTYPETKVTFGSNIDKGESFSYNLTALNAGTTYFFKAYATNDNGTSYGSILSFTANPKATFTIGSLNYQVDGVNQLTEVAPYIKDSRTLLPIINVAYCLGMADADVVWDDANQTITLTKGTRVVQLTMDSNTISVNNMNLSMDVVPEISNGRRCLPLSWVARAFGATVNWNSEARTVNIQ